AMVTTTAFSSEADISARPGRVYEFTAQPNNAFNAQNLSRAFLRARVASADRLPCSPMGRSNALAPRLRFRSRRGAAVHSSGTRPYSMCWCSLARHLELGRHYRIGVRRYVQPDLLDRLIVGIVVEVADGLLGWKSQHDDTLR